jgi:hypothetical protein
VNRTLSICLTFLFLGCSSKSVDCADELAAGKAIQLRLAQTENTCDYELLLEVEGTTTSVTCEEEGDRCLCNGGTEYGLYRIYLTGRDDVTYTALEDVTASPSPICFSHDIIERFRPVDNAMGGAGGAN